MSAPRTGDVLSSVCGCSGLRRVEAQCRCDHAFLDPSDECYFLVEYHAGSHTASAVNQLICNWKWRPASVALMPARRRRKQAAIDTVASVLRRCCDRRWVQDATWSPIPTSGAFGTREYDDRLSRTLRIAFEGYDCDVRDLLRQTASTKPDHAAVRRLSSGSLYGLLQVDLASLVKRPLRHRIILFDDLLTSGKHFKCCQGRLHETVPQVPVSGLFFARRVGVCRWHWAPPMNLE